MSGLRVGAALVAISLHCAAQQTNSPPPGVVRVDRPGRLGLSHDDLTPAELKAYGVTGPGAVVTGVVPGTVADSAGIVPGDVITEIDGKPVKTAAEVRDALKGRFAGDEVAVVVSRRGALTRYTLRLSPAPENPNAELFKLAQAGIPWAQCEIAARYRSGSGTKKDPVKARYWYEKAAKAGISKAQWALGQMYEQGEGGEVDIDRAREWYEKVALKDDPKAEYKIAGMYADGRGCIQSLKIAIRWCDQAAQQGYADAQYTMANVLWNGQGVPRDTAAAAQLYMKAANGGNLQAMATMGNMLASGQGVAKDTAAAVKLLTPAANSGIALAQYDLGALYYYGQSVPRDLAMAARWLHAAAEQGYVPSETVLAELYLGADPPNYAEAFHWSSRAAESNDPEALNTVGRLYHLGQGVPRDEQKAFDCLLKSAKGGDAAGEANVGIYYLDGDSVVPRDLGEALKWLTLAAGGNDPDTKANAELSLGTLYSLGDKHVAKNPDKAMEWFGKAAQGGQVEAARFYGQMLRDRKRYSEAATWLRKAAEKGDRAAQNDLGTMYAMGWGVPKSRVDAIAWLLRAYQQGSPTARDSLRKLGVNAK